MSLVLYKDNPNIAKLRVVTTVKGDNEYRRNCKYIKGSYYLMNRDCFEIEGTWYREDSGLIVFDHEIQQWLIKSKIADGNLVRGAVGFEDDGTPIIGYFSRNPYNNLKIRSNNGTMECINPEVVKANKFYVENIATGSYVHTRGLTNNDIAKLKVIRNERDHQNRGYNIEDNPDDFKNKVDLFEKYTPVIPKDCVSYAKFLGDITFGAEVEISEGLIAPYLQNRTGIVICRDGSIGGGPELVTIPVSGAKGLWNLKQISDILQTRGNIDINCSFHLHIGTIPTSKLFLASVYMLSRQIQDELFEMFPYYKTDPTGVKKKNYNKKLEQMGIYPLVDDSKEGYDSFIEDVYERIFKMLTEGAEDRIPGYQYNRKRREHPIRQKWNRSGRYYWMNLMNMIFSHRDTVEFRLHGPTLNSQKMINWLFICNAIIKYADKYANEIIRGKDVSLKDVLNYYKKAHPRNEKAKFLSEYLIAYYEERRSVLWTKAWKKEKDNVCDFDIRADKNYTFSYGGVVHLF